MDRLSGIFFQVRPGNTDGAWFARRWRNGNGPFAHDGSFKLADLVALRQVGIKVIFRSKIEWRLI